MALATGNLTGQYKMYRVGRGREARLRMTEREGETRLRMTEGGRAAPQNDSIPPFVILSEAKNLSSWLKDMVKRFFGAKLLRMTGGRRAAPQNDSSLVILSEAKNLFSRLKDMARKILRSKAPQNDRERGERASE